MKVKEILKVTKGKMLCGNEELEVENFSKDTRTIQKGDIYIGIKGEKFDGSNFWNQALDAGATAVIISNIQISKEEKEKCMRRNAERLNHGIYGGNTRQHLYTRLTNFFLKNL